MRVLVPVAAAGLLALPDVALAADAITITKAPLEPGDTMPVPLTLGRAGTRAVALPVLPPGAEEWRP